jgi:hypothetical protein
MVTHDLEIARTYSNKVLHLINGSVQDASIEFPPNPKQVNESQENDEYVTIENVYNNGVIDLKLNYRRKSSARIEIFIEENTVIIKSTEKVLLHTFFKKEDKSERMLKQANESSSNDDPLASRINKKKWSMIKSYFLFSLISVLIAIVASIYASTNHIDPIDYQYSHINQVGVASNDIGYLLDIYSIESKVIYILPYANKQNLIFLTSTISQYSHSEPFIVPFNTKPLPISMVSGEDILFGRMPNSPYEVVIDQMLFERVYSKESHLRYGIMQSQSMIDSHLRLSNGLDLRIVGISITQTPTIYLDLGILYASVVEHESIGPIIPESKATFTDSNLIFENEFDVYVHIDEYLHRVESSLSMIISIGDSDYTIKGSFESDSDEFKGALIITDERLTKIVFNQLIRSNYAELIIVSKNDWLETESLSIDLISMELSQFLVKFNERVIIANILILVLITVIIVSSYQIVKTIIMENKKVVSIKIILGVKKVTLLSKYFFKTLMSVLLFVTPVFLLISFLIYHLTFTFAIKNQFLHFQIEYLLTSYGLFICVQLLILILLLFLFFHGTPISIIKRLQR